MTLGDVQDYSYNIVNDQALSFKEIVEHMVTVHGCRDFVLVSSDRDKSFLREREDIFTAVMEEHGIAFSKDKIVNGNLKSNCGREVVRKILDLYRGTERKLPEAIVCVNDYTVLGVLNALHCLENTIVICSATVPRMHPISSLMLRRVHLVFTGKKLLPGSLICKVL